jgi:acetyl esterase/lipase
VPKLPVAEGLTVEDHSVPGPEGAPPVRVRLYRPQGAVGPVPALLWLHGGGFVVGAPEQDEASSLALARGLGLVVAAVQYRLAPANPFPAPLEDCYAALRWLHAQAGRLGIAPGRIAIGGASAGGGLAAGLALLAHDRKEVPVAFQLLVYPMLDDATVTRADLDASSMRLWTPESNRFGWRAYLGKEPGSADVEPYAAPARRKDLSSLPPAWIGVGTFDLFHDEDLAYAKRLRLAGVPCEVLTVPGAYHGFDAISPKATVVREFRLSFTEALKRGLFPSAL